MDKAKAKAATLASRYGYEVHGVVYAHNARRPDGPFTKPAAWIQPAAAWYAVLLDHENKRGYIAYLGR